MTSTVRKYSYDVYIHLGSLSLAVKFPCQVGTVWQSYMKNLQAESKPDLIQGTSYLRETLYKSMIMEYDTSRNVYNPKITTLKILLYTEKGVRQAGQVDFDLAEVLNKKMKEMTVQLKLDKCPDKKGKISFTIKMVVKEEVKNQVSFAANLVSDVTFGKPQLPNQQRNDPSLPPFQHIFKQSQMTHQNQIINPEQNLFHHQPIQNDIGLHSVPRLIPPHIQIKVSPPPPSEIIAAPPQLIETFKQEHDALLAQNVKILDLLKQSQMKNQIIRNQLMKSLSQKQTIYAQLQSFGMELTRLKMKNQELQKVEEMYKQAQEELIIARTQLAKIFNAATDLGGIVLTDKLQTAIGIQEQQYYHRQSPQQQLEYQQQSQLIIHPHAQIQHQTYQQNQIVQYQYQSSYHPQAQPQLQQQL